MSLYEWLSLVFRWIHVIAGIAWIGASFYFNWLEGNLERDDKPQGLAGDLWAVHGGGFYHVVKLKGAPDSLPKHLHWFKYEAYLTWISGIGLLAILYYAQASLYLLDASKAMLSAAEAIGLSIAGLVAAWGIYHYLLCRSPIVRMPRVFVGVMLAFFTAAAYFYHGLFSDRAAYIQIGAMIGTIMAANVFFVIIPSQKIMVAAAEARKPLADTTLGAQAGLRSLHNNYFTLPLIFIMISNHYPMTFGHSLQWAVLLGISLVALAVRHFFNLKNRKHYKPWILPTSLVAFILLAWAAEAYTVKTKAQPQTTNQEITDIDAAAIINDRCRTCHSEAPKDDVFVVAPSGVTFDSLSEVRSKASQIKLRVVETKTMPFGNKTHMTDEEREKLAVWLDKGPSH